MQLQSRPAALDSDNAYLAYSYSYPHKTAYRNLDAPVSLADAWANEPTNALFLYTHIPFCEMRCGFCNLFTTTNPEEDFVDVYLKSLRRQAAQVSACVADASFARMAIGGGTPTFLSATQLDKLFSTLQDVLDAHPSLIPTSVESSPLTAVPDKITVLEEHGVSRVSIGVQSFLEDEVRSIGRSQRTSDVMLALERLQESTIPTINVDLIYGIPEQTHRSWLHSLKTAVSYEPEEIYLYPLYVRPMTGLGNLRQRKGSDFVAANSDSTDNRLDLYRIGRDYLLSSGYKQASMRMFQAAHAPSTEGPVYCCQTDGMIGIGCGARSYTTNLHYSHNYAVGAKPIMSILQRYVDCTDEQFARADYGFVLSEDERKRRFVLQSLLQVEGLDVREYLKTWSGINPVEEYTVLKQLLGQGFAHVDAGSGAIKLTESGLELSDQIGVWLYSDSVISLMHEAEVI